MKKKKEQVDAYTPATKAKVRSAIRQVWSFSHSRRLVVKRCTDADGFQVCEECGKRVPKIQVDHIIPVGDIEKGGIKRMFCPSKGLRGLCPACHRIKTKQDKEKGLI